MTDEENRLPVSEQSNSPPLNPTAFEIFNCDNYLDFRNGDVKPPDEHVAFTPRFSPKSNPLGLCLVILIFLVALIFFIVMIAAANDVRSRLISSVIVIELATVGAFMSLLIYITNDSSISAMVAQRWNSYSYLTILAIVAFGSTLAAFFMTTATQNLDKSYNYVLCPFSIYLCLGILVAPLPVWKTSQQLGMIPIHHAKVLKLHPGYFDANQSDPSTYNLKYELYRLKHPNPTSQPSNETINLDPEVNESIRNVAVYKLLFFDVDRKIPYLKLDIWTAIHCALVCLGYFLGVAVIIFRIWFLDNQSFTKIITGIMLIVSVISGIFFMVLGPCLQLANREIFAAEVVMLMMFFTAMCMLLTLDDGLIDYDICKVYRC